MKVMVSAILREELIRRINEKHNTSYTINNIDTIRFVKNGITIWMNDENWYMMKFDILRDVEVM